MVLLLGWELIFVDGPVIVPLLLVVVRRQAFAVRETRSLARL